jgi:1-deoxy-D-xylulose-5-phosphate reductoisomerase
MKKKISILGSTGSIGLSTLKIIDKKIKFFKINILTANKNYLLICDQIIKYKPKFFVILNKKVYEKVKKKFKKKNNIKILHSFNQIKLKNKSDITISAIPGISGLQPTILMTKISKKILIANKESVICGWDLIKKIALKSNTELIPVDSEHFSIFYLLKNHKLKNIKKIFITASGGPFLEYTKKQLKKIKPKDALKHPKWRMGKKISVDSSTLMNKMFELIEAQKLFDIPDKKLEVLIHPESLVHAIIMFKNGLSKFLYHETSMIIPIANAIFNENIHIDELITFKKQTINSLTFKKVKQEIFPIIKIKKRLNEYSSTPIILNAANEVLVDHFLREKIPYLSINKIIMTILNDKNYKKYAIRKNKNINQINIIDSWARSRTKEYIKINYE